MQDMRALFLPVFLVVLSIPLQAQYEEILLPQNRLAFNLMSIKAHQVVDEGPRYYPYFFSGLRYKRLIDDNILRFTFSYFHKLEETLDIDFSRSGTLKEVEMGFGYQRNFTDYRIKPYVAADLSILMNSAVRKNNGVKDESYEKKVLDKFGIGISPAVGLRFETGSALSFSFETSLQFLMSWKNGITFFHLPYTVPITNEIKESGLYSSWNPVSGIFVTLDF